MINTPISAARVLNEVASPADTRNGGNDSGQAGLRTDPQSLARSSVPPADVDVLAGNLDRLSLQASEDLVYNLLLSLPRNRLASLQRRILPLLQFDLVASLPTEIALQIFALLPAEALDSCSRVSRRWRALACDQTIWKNLCDERDWKWCTPTTNEIPPQRCVEQDDEGMGDEEDEGAVAHESVGSAVDTSVVAERSYLELDSGYVSFSTGDIASTRIAGDPNDGSSNRTRTDNPPSTPPVASFQPTHLACAPPSLAPDYRLLHRTHTKLIKRFRAGSYRRTVLQGPQGHSNTIYCLQLHTYPATSSIGSRQVLFTGSRDRTVREWDLASGSVTRVISGVHTSSVLSLCVREVKVDGQSITYLATAGSDCRVALYNLSEDRDVCQIQDHEDSVLCVRFDDKRLVTCSKDHTIRTYSFPDLQPLYTLLDHRAAVNAVALCGNLIVSGSGDRSVRLWNAESGQLLRTFENHHHRGIASIDFKLPYVLSGSSDKHLRLFDVLNASGWSTCPPEPAGTSLTAETPGIPSPDTPTTTSMRQVACPTCGATVALRGGQHDDLVRSVALGSEFVVSGSYDLTIKVWERATGTLVADLKGGHTGRIFCVAFDPTKIVSCGEDQRICIWNFSHGIDTSFIQI
ncbi:WD40 repeat-like protein [Schizophyllum commune H4-8]|uniref:WD40 repeat-like protein n=1 Tax=Schizophyllum commune (strain H4-8 / FGSC 9210) TaxID=578458 RepID=UPI00215DF193|nr:WD40 repeat-like protein [Schizophyllum commune H4-8]KAI5898464.1 WD40 repeat-like protein [Schizophyllum commune H4-8]